VTSEKSGEDLELMYVLMVLMVAPQATYVVGQLGRRHEFH